MSYKFNPLSRDLDYYKNKPKDTSATTAPGVGDDSADGYTVGSFWFDTVAEEGYVCLDTSPGAAVWKGITSVAGGTPAARRIFLVT